MMKSKIKKQTILFLSVLILFHLTVNYVWHSSNKMPQGKGAFEHLNKSANLLRILKGDLKPHFYKQEHSYLYNLIFLTYKWPPLYYYSGLFFYVLLFPILGFNAIYAASSFFFSLLIIFSYKTSKFNYNHKVGLFSAFFCSFIPYTSYVSRQYNLEMASTALVLISYYYLLKSEKFTNKKYSIIAGLFSGISLLFKYSSAIFIFSYILLSIKPLSLNVKKYHLKTRTANLSLFSIITIIISLLYYSNMLVIKSLFKRAIHPEFINTQIDRIYFYINGFIFDLMGILIFFIFILCSFLFLKKKKERNILIFLIAIPLLIISAVPKSDLQSHIDYMIPFLPIVTMLCAATLLSIKKNILRKCLLSYTITVLIFQFFAVSFIIPEGRPIFAHYGFSNIASLFAFSRAPVKKSPYSDVYKYISHNKPEEKVKIGMISQSVDIFAVIFETHVYFQQNSWDIINFSLNKDSFYKYLGEYDYLIYSSNVFNDFLAEDKRLKKVKNKIELKKGYIFQSTIPFFNFEEKIFIFKNKMEPACISYSPFLRTEAKKQSEKNRGVRPRK